MERKNKWDRPVKMPVSVHKTQVSSTERSEFREDKRSADPNKHCPLHKKPHPLRKCRGFREKSLEERKQLLKENYVSFRCCSSTDHLARNCSAEVKCMECGSTGHVAALHPGPPVWKPKPSPPSSEHGGVEDKADIQEVTSRCTQVCGEGVSSRACSKICLVSVYPARHRGEAKKMYAMLDEQSNRSLARSKFFDLFNISGSSYPYTLKTCAGQIETTGRRACGFTVESADKGISFPLPTLLECNQIPNNPSEIPTPTAALHHTHLKHIADVIPPLDPDTDILLLLGRDILRVHNVREQISGPGNAPFAQRLDLGWVVVGDVCLGGAHRPLEVNSYKTSILDNGRASHLQPCNSQIKVKEIFSQAPNYSHHAALTPTYCSTTHSGDSLGQTIFTRTADDHKLAPSVEDMMFYKIMEAEFHQDISNSWVGPVPFRSPRKRLPNNKKQVHNRLLSLRRTLDKRPQMKAHFIEFMENMLSKGHAEVAPPLKQGQECWYLPLFGVYHPKKPDKIRVVFDSSASYEGVSLNEVLLTGPDLNNSLLGVLMRFRKEQVAITASVRASETFTTGICTVRSTTKIILTLSCVIITVISGLYSAPINMPHLLIFKRKKKLYINKPRLSISRRCPRDCGQASRHGNSTAPIILTFTVNTSKPPRMGRWGPESSVRGTTSGFHSSLHSVSLSFALSMSLSSRGKSALELALSSSSWRVYTGRWSAVLRRATTPWSAALRYAAPWSDRFGIESIFSARRERIAAGNTLKNELYVWSRSGIAGWPAWGNARPV